ncbi:hypothetical protein ACIPEN_14445 [Herbaspirillum chlorophenolicum]|uniref:Uncharacterized protein n=1 Tax=Herbaspirillum chlorophenolicum TaxID=211589 RepID=A0ABW8F165_9BURK
MTDQEIIEMFEEEFGAQDLDVADAEVISFARALLAKADEEIKVLHTKLAGETLRADQGWTRYEAANTARLNSDAALAKAVPEGFVVVPKEPTEGMLRPFYNCPPEELRMGYVAMLMVSPSPEGEKKP